MKWFLPIIFGLLWYGNAFGYELVIKHIRPQTNTDQRDEYYISVLELALEKTKGSDGAFRLEQSVNPMHQGRAFEELTKNNIDLVWSMTSIEREHKVLPIRIPLLKGLLGHRIFIIRREDQQRFSSIKTVQQLKQLVAGQGHDWPDFKILRANDFNVISSSSYEGLFGMLQRGRFDYFPRGVNEPWHELAKNQHPCLVVEQNLLLQYPAAVYFFVNRNNIKLMDRIERGLRIAIQDGSFDQLLYNHPISREIFENANIENRRVFKLKTRMTKESLALLDEKELWYDASEQRIPASIN